MAESEVSEGATTGSTLMNYTWEEVSKHNTPESLWVVIDNMVYDVTTFKNDHPGGDEVLLKQGGSDATSAFEDVGHSPDARELRNTYLIGQVVDSKPRSALPTQTPAGTSGCCTGRGWLGAIAIGAAVVAIVAVVVYKYRAR